MEYQRRLFFHDLIGQADTFARLRSFVEIFPQNVAIGHILLKGGDGMGKRSIVMALANERDVLIQETDAVDIKVQGDLTAIITNLRDRQILLINNLHLMKKCLADNLIKTVREGRFTVNIGSGPAARSHVFELCPFTLAATCPNNTLCPEDLLHEFSLTMNLQPYTRDELISIALKLGSVSGIAIDLEAASLLAGVCDGRPSHLESLIRRVSKAINMNVLNSNDVLKTLKAFGLSESYNISHVVSSSIERLSGEEFERMISTLLNRMGFRTELTKTSGDGGIDIIAVLDRPIFRGRYLFQCKRYSQDNLVSAPAIRDFYGAVTADRATKGIFITTSEFTTQARDFGEKVGIELIDSHILESLFGEYALMESI
jgi:Holliday junction resolvasome RuvABC ATP-dependent DNA helicase subunit